MEINEIRLHLSGHCIETAAKKRYEKIVNELLGEVEPEREKELEEELELLLEFLKKADFAKLRRDGFDGKEEMWVRIKKSGKNFVVERV